jgi:hypothetical protein
VMDDAGRAWNLLRAAFARLSQNGETGSSWMVRHSDSGINHKRVNEIELAKVANRLGIS